MVSLVHPWYDLIEGESLYPEDKDILLSTEWLNDRIINAAQKQLKMQSSLKGFQSIYFTGRRCQNIIVACMIEKFFYR